eukprot:TRINITY_DN17109_c0_g1_i1.p1 TRINITY_DN17109_c0_g1~~TRINITY_DN17109_c0_g1_i1.p1  ORF type:complete len:109 (+),score=40.31 TRINITY_DN17109_c0_g1_i1:33-329(+)
MSRATAPTTRPSFSALEQEYRGHLTDLRNYTNKKYFSGKSPAADLNPAEEMLVEGHTVVMRRHPNYDDYAVQHEILFPLTPAQLEKPTSSKSMEDDPK